MRRPARTPVDLLLLARPGQGGGSRRGSAPRRRAPQARALARFPFDFSGLESINAIRRLLEIAATDALGLETSVAKVRLLISVAVAAAKLLETGELADRIAALEAALSRPDDMATTGDFG